MPKADRNYAAIVALLNFFTRRLFFRAAALAWIMPAEEALSNELIALLTSSLASVEPVEILLSALRTVVFVRLRTALLRS